MERRFEQVKESAKAVDLQTKESEKVTEEKFSNVAKSLEEIKRDIIGTTAVLKEKDANIVQDCNARLEQMGIQIAKIRQEYGAIDSRVEDTL